MSQTIEQDLQRFIDDPQLKVLVIKGPWGVGKTFLWKNYWKKYAKSKIGVCPYAYVSLFGQEDLEGLRSSILSKAEFSDKKLSVKGMKKRLRKLLGDYAKDADIPWLGNGQLIGRIVEERALRGYMVCLDDFERKGEDLSAGTILGLVSELKEDRECKVVLIFNSEAMDPDSSGKFDEFREKVVDLELEYSPSVHENLQVVWGREVPDYVEDVFVRLRQNNIRLMQKVKIAIRYFSKAIECYSDWLQKSFNRNLTILTVFYFSHTKEEFSVIISTSFGILTWADDDEEGSKLKEKYQHVQDVNYYNQDFDPIIIDYLDRGYVEFGKYEKILSQGDAIAITSKASQEYSRIWNGLHRGFAVKHDEFVDELRTFTKENYENLQLSSICSCESILKKFGEESEDVAALVQKKALAVADSLERFDWSDWSLGSIPKDIIEMVQGRFNENQQVSYSISDAIKPLASSSTGWTPSEMIRLRRFSAEDFYEWLLNESELNTTSLMKKFGERFSDDGKYGGDEVWKKMKVALDRIRSRSKADEFRVSGILKESLDE